MNAANTVIFEFEGYCETVLMQSSNNAIRIIECTEDNSIVAYRIEAPDTSVNNYLAVTFDNAVEVYADALNEMYTGIYAMKNATLEVASYVDRFHDAKCAIIAAEYAEIVAKEQQISAFLHYVALENALNASNTSTISAKIV